MPLDPHMAGMLAKLNEMPPMHTLGVEALRNMPAIEVKPVPVGSVRDLSFPGPAGPLRARLYRATAGSEILPLIVFFHGGGMVLGNLDSHDQTCRSLCAGAGCAVLAIDYRLAPENKFPAAPDDCLAAVRWAAANAASLGADPARLAVAGDSAGGNLAAVTALRLRDEGGPQLRGQLLIYPMTDWHDPPTPSALENAEGYFLSRNDMVWFWEQYVATEEDGTHHYAAPLRAKDLSGLPPALVITAEYDPLRDEGESYAERLKAAGVPTQATRYDGVIHGFFSMPLARGVAAIAESCEWLKERFAG